MGKLLLPVLITLFVAACGPRDIPMGTNRASGTGASQVVEAEGALPSTCPGNPWSTVSVPNSDDAKVFSGQVTASMSIGDRNCLKIGSIVDIRNRNETASRGQVKITRIEILPAASLGEVHARAMGLSVSELQGRAMAEIQAIENLPQGAPGKFPPQGHGEHFVFSILRWHAVSHGFLVVDQEGELSETCPGNPWTSISSPNADDPALFAGDLTGSLSIGDRNCLKIGSVVDIKNRGESVSRGQVKIIRVEILPMDKLDETHAKAMNTTLSALKARASAEIKAIEDLPQGAPGKFPPKGMVSISFFEFVGGNGPKPEPNIVVFQTEGQMAPTCPATFTPSKAIDVPADQDALVVSGKVLAAMAAGDRNCFQIGSIIDLKAKGPESVSRGKLKVVWVEIVPVTKLNNDHASLLNISLADLKSKADAALAAVTFDAKGTVNFTVFEYVGPAQ